jgi:hypothetical protein
MIVKAHLNSDSAKKCYIPLEKERDVHTSILLAESEIVALGNKNVDRILTFVTIFLISRSIFAHRCFEPAFSICSNLFG